MPDYCSALDITTVTAGNVTTGGNVTFGGNMTSGNVTTVISGNMTSGNVTTGNVTTFGGNMTSGNVTTVTTGGNVTFGGNMTTGNVTTFEMNPNGIEDEEEELPGANQTTFQRISGEPPQTPVPGLPGSGNNTDMSMPQETKPAPPEQQPESKPEEAKPEK
jgi:hypothetical protein